MYCCCWAKISVVLAVAWVAAGAGDFRPMPDAGGGEPLVVVVMEVVMSRGSLREDASDTRAVPPSRPVGAVMRLATTVIGIP